MSGYTTDKTDVEVPDWADVIGVNDRVRWETPSGRSGTSRVIGFSTVEENRGKPVIEAPEFIREDNPSVETVALELENIVGLEGVDEVERARRKVEEIQNRVIVRE